MKINSTAALALFAASSLSGNDPALQWELVYQAEAPVTSDFQNVIFYDEQFIAYSVQGVVGKSSDGVHWTFDAIQREDEPDASFLPWDIVVGDSQLLMRDYLSEDGILWEPALQDFTFADHITYGNGRWLLLGTKDDLQGIPATYSANISKLRIWSSIDARSWTPHEDANISEFLAGLSLLTYPASTSISFVDGAFVFGGRLTSLDGVNWAKPGTHPFDREGYLTGGDGLYLSREGDTGISPFVNGRVAIGDDATWISETRASGSGIPVSGTTIPYYSGADGIAWYYVQSSQRDYSIKWQAHAAAGEISLEAPMVGGFTSKGEAYLITANTIIHIDDEGAAIDSITSAAPLKSVAAGNDIAVAVGDAGLIVVRSASSDQWVEQRALQKVAAGADRIVTLGHGYSIVSTDGGATWASHTFEPMGELLDLRHDGSQFLAVTRSGDTWGSTDGAIWQHSGNTGAGLTVHAPSATYELSPDGVLTAITQDGSSIVSETFTHPYDLVYGSGLVAVTGKHTETLGGPPGRGPLIEPSPLFYSVDATGGLMEYPRAPQMGMDARGTAYGAGRFVVVGNNIHVYPVETYVNKRHPDLKSARSHNSGLSRLRLNAVTYTGSRFVAVGANNEIYQSAIVEEIHPFWEQAFLGADGWRLLPNDGWIWEDPSGEWTYHVNIGWLWHYPNTYDGFWFEIPGIGWVWSRLEYFPWAQTPDDEWWLVDLDTFTPDLTLWYWGEEPEGWYYIHTSEL